MLYLALYMLIGMLVAEHFVVAGYDHLRTELLSIYLIFVFFWPLVVIDEIFNIIIKLYRMP